MLTAAEERYRYSQRVNAAGVLAARRVWGRLDRADVGASWAALSGRMVAVVAAMQTLAARGADEYATAALGEQGIDAEPVGSLVPEALAGAAADGRTLDGLLFSAVVDTRTALGEGATIDRALEMGRNTLDRLVLTTLQDTGRAAAQVATVARPTVAGYVRQLNLPSCSRCVVLAGRFYRWSAGFDRHPRCDCVHVPSSQSRAGDLTTDPRKAVASGMVTGLSAAERQAIEDGADVSQVVNIHRGGLTTADGLSFTREGTTSKGLAGARTPGQRPTPETIYRLASDRAEAIELLRRYAYII